MQIEFRNGKLKKVCTLLWSSQDTILVGNTIKRPMKRIYLVLCYKTKRQPSNGKVQKYKETIVT